jgi:hypothetical protein
MLRVLLVLATMAANASDTPRLTLAIPQCARPPHAASQNGQKLAQQCVQGICCGQVGCWVKCPCW